ncbi:helix-turn-helix domain-containing protein [Georgenia ruanii]|uniref:Helix-turn-helix domain-containing protein n=1 Tax=Georgenia ruanii TaxID=348442 RepID=A0A7J9UYZ6_9MICO|nr:helix-turn-helix domain-containing protein [Georgenia ruanii]MPV89563.1 helix-turn-helix domain-containing protein [Georgenia ruanii]
MSEPRRIDPVERAHLRDAEGYAPPISRYTPSPDLGGLVRRYWLPVWSLPPGHRSVQRVLQYPVCLLVVTDADAWLVGPVAGLSTQELAGTGWAVGAMLQPAAGSLLLGGPVTAVTDRRVDLGAVAGLDGTALAQAVRDAVGDAPADGQRQRAAVAVIEAALGPLLPVDEEGALVNAIVEHVEADPTVQRVAQLCARFGLTERTLQRLTARRIGLSPKWLIQRRRLHDAAERLRVVPEGRSPGLARLASELGYADQAHFARDFRTATGLTPREFAAEPRR